MDHTLRCKTLSSLRQGSYYINLAQCQNYNRHFPSISSTELKWSILDSKGRAHIKDKMCFLSGCVGHTVIPLGLKSWLLETFESLIPKWPWVLESSDGDTLNCFSHKTNFSFVYIWVLYGSMSPFPLGWGSPYWAKVCSPNAHDQQMCSHRHMCEALSPSHHHPHHPSNKWLDESITKWHSHNTSSGGVYISLDPFRW